MRVLYYTNSDINDWDLVPNIIKNTGDEVITHTSKFDLNFIIENNIDFIVSDRSRYIIKKDIIDYLPKKIVNLHPSFLPWNKGYHPNYWSIVEDTPFGVTLHYIDEGIDTGDIIAQTRAFFSEEDTFRITYNRLRKLMVSLFDSCWQEIREVKIGAAPQNKLEGNIHFKKDFVGIYEILPNGWDTKICDLQKKLGK